MLYCYLLANVLCVDPEQNIRLYVCVGGDGGDKGLGVKKQSL